ncbi:MAG: lysophospholipid acyltransferase family protein [Geminicoccaceae bacterium]
MSHSHPPDRVALSYAAPEDGPLRQGMIRLVERLSGQRRAERIYHQLRRGLRPDSNVWSEAVRGLAVNLRHDATRLAAAPRTGPLVVVANHPFGVVDGLILCHLVSLVRRDFKVVAMSTLCRVPEVRDYVLPINFAETAEAAAVSARSRREARTLLKQGGCLIIFPGGAVSTSRRPFGPAVDNEWHPFAGRLILAARAAVLPVHFAGQNSRMFQLVSCFSSTLRISLLVRETLSRIGSDIHVRIGGILPFASLGSTDDPKRLIARLRDLTYAISLDRAA